MTSKEQGGRVIVAVLATVIVLASNHAEDGFARSWVEDSVRYVEVTHAGHDMAQGSQIGAVKCRKKLGMDKLAAHTAGQFSRAAYRQLSELLGVRVHVTGMQRETEKLATGSFRTRCSVADTNISASLTKEPSRADIAQARLQAGVKQIASNRYREGIDILKKLRNEANYQDALPAIVAGLANVDVSLAMEADKRYIRLAEAGYRPALVEYIEALSDAGWAERVLEAQKRLDDLPVAHVDD